MKDDLATIARSPRRLCVPTLTVVVPAHNEAQNLPALLEALDLALSAEAVRWQLLVVDDGSTDDSATVLQALRAARPPGSSLRVLRLSRNFGKEAALSAGLAHAEGEVVVLMDADGQHPAALLPEMLQHWRAGADMVCAQRADRGDEAWFKRAATRVFYRLVNAGARVDIPADVGDFRLLDRRVVDTLNALPERNRFMKGLFAWVGFKTQFVRYRPPPRQHGASRFSTTRLLRLALTGLTAFSTLPLRLWSGLGALIALAALVYGTVVVAQVLWRGHPLPGWPTLAAGIMFLGGVQLLSIGVLGEYLGRVFEEVKQRPLYVVSEDSGESA